MRPLPFYSQVKTCGPTSVFFKRLRFRRTEGEDLVPVKCMEATNGLGCSPFQGGGSVDSLFIVAPIVCVGSVFWSLFCYAVLSALSSFALILKRKSEKVS